MNQAKIGNIDLVKQLNAAAIYRLIDKHSPISRIQITELCGLAPASVTKITRQLIERGLIKEIEQQASTGGRRPVSLTTECRPFHCIAVRLERKKISLSLFDLAANSLGEHQVEFHCNSQQALIEGLVQHIHAFINHQQKKIKALIAIAITLPGLVDSVTGIVSHIPNLSIEKLALSQLIGEKFNVPCFIGNDIRSLALAESYFGASKNYQDSLLINIHHGVGAGIIVQKEIFLGANQNVGEIGHIQIDPLGKKCQCKNFGCLETLVANSEIVEKLQSFILQGYPSQLAKKKTLKLTDICQAANASDELSIQVLTQAGNHLGKALAITVNLFNPELIVISGEITKASDIVFAQIKRSIEKQSLSAFNSKLKIVKSELMEQPTLNAFALIKQAMLNGELLTRILKI